MLFRKGQKLWLVTWNQYTMPCVAPCTYQSPCKGLGSSFVRYVRCTPSVPGGQPTVVDRPDNDLFKTKRDAILQALKQTHDRIARLQLHLIELAKGL